MGSPFPCGKTGFLPKGVMIQAAPKGTEYPQHMDSGLTAIRKKLAQAGIGREVGREGASAEKVSREGLGMSMPRIWSGQPHPVWS